MKKIFLVTLSFHAICFYTVSAQTPGGYENLPWGAEAAELTSAYPNAELSKDKVLFFDPDNITADFSSLVACYIENKAGHGIINRSFLFYEQRLFCVSIMYDHGVYKNKAATEPLRNSLEAAYGVFTDLEPSIAQMNYGIFSVKGERSGCYKNIHQNMTVELEYIEWKVPIIGKRIQLIIRYYDPIVQKHVLTAGRR